jgi:prepilin signal peptidase PulO-like enzyme (type II secretory pathway)
MAEAITFAIFAFLGASFASLLFSLVHHPIASLFRRSSCDQCHLTLRPHQLIPIFSSLVLRNQCVCGHRPSLKYGFGELVMASIFTVNACAFGFSLAGILMNVLSLIGFYTSLLDWEMKKIPLYSPVIIGILGCVWAYIHHQFPWLVVFMLIVITFLYYASKWFVRGKAIGEGDILLLLASSIWLPWMSLPIFLFLTGMLGVASAFIYKHKGKAEFPFAPAIIISLWLTLLF